MVSEYSLFHTRVTTVHTQFFCRHQHWGSALLTLKLDLYPRSAMTHRHAERYKSDKVHFFGKFWLYSLDMTQFGWLKCPRPVPLPPWISPTATKVLPNTATAPEAEQQYWAVWGYQPSSSSSHVALCSQRSKRLLGTGPGRSPWLPHSPWSLIHPPTQSQDQKLWLSVAIATGTWI